MLSNVFKQRLKNLEQRIIESNDLLNDLQSALATTTHPITKADYEKEIKRQEELLAKYKQECDEIKQELAGTSDAQMQNIDSQLEQMDAKLDVLIIGQDALSKKQNEIRNALLNRYDSIERTIISAITQQLNETQLVLTQNLIDALEDNLISELDMQQMLAVLEERIPALPLSQAAVVEIIKDPELDVKHKLRVTLPIIPMLMEYEGEVELGSGLNIKSMWQKLVNKLKSKKQAN